MLLKKNGYQLSMPDDGNFEVRNASGDLVFITNNGTPFLPVTNRAVIWSQPTIEHTACAGQDVFTFAMASNNLYANPRVVMECKDDYIEFYFTGTVKRRMTLDKWYLLGKGSSINAIECLDFRSHIDSSSAYLVHQTVLGRRKLGTIGLDANTEDSDLMFAPHPMLFVFQHLEDRLLIGPMELVAAESLYIKMIKGSTIIEDYHIEVGPNIYWLEEGEELESPHFMITLAHGKDVYETLAQYTGYLVDDGRVTAKTEDEMADWWLSPMWCSWGDQHTVLDSAEVIHLATTPEQRAQAVHNISDAMVEKAARVIEQHDLPVRTLIIDDRWYTKQGDMYADTAKFPNFRATVDGLHNRGFKVMAWSSLYQFERDCQAFQNHPEWFLIHHYHRNWHNPEHDIICLDYSNPEICAAYLGELMERLLSDKPGCYNLDGIKFDWPFLLPHNYAFSNRDWVGKEKTIYHIQKAVYTAAKAVKKDALIIGVSPHPFFNDTQDIIRTYDVSTFDIRIHLERAKYIRAIAPGMLPGMDEHVFSQNFFTYMREGSKLGIPMIYNLLRFNGDGHVYTEEDYQELKASLDDYVARTPKLRNYLAGVKA
jgi:hypothetical protein